MNCHKLQQLIDETPLSLWSEEQKDEAHDHCLDCSSCATLLEQQTALFRVFEKLELPQPSTPIETTFELPLNTATTDSPIAELLQAKKASHSTTTGLLSKAAILFLPLGILYQLFQSGEVPLFLIADGKRLQSAIELTNSSPILVAALILAGLVYCFGSETSRLSK